MNEAHGQNYNAEQFIGAMDEEEIRVAIHDGLRSLRSIAESLSVLVKCTMADDLGRPAIRIAGEIVGGDGDVTADVR